MKKIEYIIVNVLTTILSFIPKSFGKNLGTFLGKLWFSIDKKHRFMAIHNLTKIYKDKLSKQEIKKLAKQNFIFHTITFFEILRLKRLSRQKILNEIDNVEGIENYLKAKKTGKPIFILSAHFGNWELMAAVAPLLLGNPIYLIARKLDSSGLDKIIKEIRGKTGNTVIDKKHSADMVRKILRGNNTIGILLDQRALMVNSVEAPFMGYPSRTNKGLALYDLRYNPEIVPIFSYRQKNGKYKIKILPPVNRPKRDNFKKDIVKYTSIYNDVLSKEIYENPDHWFWFHDRWEKKEEFFGKKKY